MNYKIINTGFFYADGGAMFGAIPKRAWKRKLPSDDDNCCRLTMRCVLAWNENHLILLDTGVGTKALERLSYYRFHDLLDLKEEIIRLGFSPEQITDVVLSHLHFDHCGGCTYIENDELKITFPHVRHWVSRKQWENYIHPNQLEIDSYRAMDMVPVFESGQIFLVDEAMDICPDFHIELYDGHTFGQIVSFINTNDKLLVFPADVIPTKAHLSLDWISAYDIQPLESILSKERLLQKLEGKNFEMIHYH